MMTNREQLDFSVITPSYNMLPYLKRCSFSIADQKNITFEHLVVDGGSNDGTVKWLENNPNIFSIVEPDKGMYDAINKGLKHAKGQLLSYLNCDEQYLPGALSFVKRCFEEHSDIDVIFGDAILVDSNGDFLAYRKGYQPKWPYIATSHLYVLTCTMFLRRNVVEQEYLFNRKFKVLGDIEFVIRLLRAGFKVKYFPRYLSTFTITDNNLSYDEKAELERLQIYNAQPGYIKLLKYPLNVLRLIEKVASGAYQQSTPLIYQIYTQNKLTQRTEFAVKDVKRAWQWPDPQN